MRLCNARARAAADNRSLLPNDRSLLTGRVCAAADNLGRVLLLDMEDLTVLRFFKGYRESEVNFFTSVIFFLPYGGSHCPVGFQGVP